METQIAGLTGSQNEPFYELLHPNSTSSSTYHSNNGVAKAMENLDLSGDILSPTYDSQSIKAGIGASSSTGANSVTSQETYQSTAPPRSSPTPIASYFPKVRTSTEHCEPAQGASEQDRERYEAAMMAAIERTMKKHADNLLNALEAMSGRFTQLEYKTQHLESSVGELKISVGNSHGETDGRMRLLENLLREVQTGVQLLRDKQEIAEVHSQLMKSQLLKNDSPDNTSLQESSATKPIDTHQQIGYAAQHQPTPPFSLFSQSQPYPSSLMPNTPSPPPPIQSGNAPTHAFPAPPPQQAVSVQPHASSTLGPQQIHASTPTVPSESSFQTSLQHSSAPPPPLPPAPAPPQYQVPHSMQQVPPNAIQMPSYTQQPLPPQPSSQTVSVPLSQTELPSHSSVNPVLHRPMPVPTPPSHYGPEPPYIPTNYGGPNSRQQSQPMPVPQHHIASPQHLTGGQQAYESSFGRTTSSPMSLPPAYAAGLSGPVYNDSQSYSGPPFRVPQPVPSAPSGGGGHARLPSAKPVQHSLPVASSVSGSPSGSAGSSNRVPVDDVVDKVTAMGFSREQVKAVIRKLTENGHSVDLNVVLDKLMNGGEIQPQKGWFGR